MKALWIFLVLLFSLSRFSALADVEVSAQLQRSNYLLYERVDLFVTLHNNTDADLQLSNTPEHPWLSFLVTRPNGIPVHAEGESNFPDLNLKMGETKTLKVNLTPLFTFRQVGDYHCQAILEMPGSSPTMSNNNTFSVVNGKTVWTQSRPAEGSQRVYSLIRFTPEIDRTALYLRVEDPTENIVYTNLALGNLVSYIDPDVYFDPDGNIHILQPIAMETYLYSRADSSGHLLHQGLFRTFREVPPHLLKVADGNIIVQGGLPVDNGPQERLSDTKLTSTVKTRDGNILAQNKPSSPSSKKDSSKAQSDNIQDPDDGPGSGHLPLPQ